MIKVKNVYIFIRLQALYFDSGDMSPDFKEPTCILSQINPGDLVLGLTGLPSLLLFIYHLNQAMYIYLNGKLILSTATLFSHNENFSTV